jgi:hypothetical protein
VGSLAVSRAWLVGRLCEFCLPVSRAPLLGDGLALLPLRVCLPVNRFRLPVNRFRLPVNRFRLPVNRFRLPVNRFRLPVNRLVVGQFEIA